MPCCITCGFSWMRVSLDELGGLTRRLFVKLDYPDEQTEIIVSILAYAHCRGNFQSLIQEVAFGTPRFQARREMVVEKETALSCMIDAGGNIGMCAMRLAIDLLAEKVKNIGLAIAGIRNSSPPGTGPVGYYAERLAREGFVSLVFCGSSKMVSPHGSCERAFGSNPIAIAIPTGGEPIVLDMATSVMPVFKVVEALLKDERLPEGRGYDAQGTPTQSPQAILKAGALRAFDLGPKSSGLALVVEILSNALTGGCLADDPNNENWGNLALAIDPELLVGNEAFLGNVNRLVTYLKGLRRTDPARAISLPGEVANLRAHEALAAQEVEIDDDLFFAYRDKISLT